MEGKGTVLITGASGGIGLALARCFARGGFPLLLTARNADKLAQAAAELRAAHGVSVQTLPLDLALSGAPAELAGVAERLDPALEILVNNAGYGAYGPFAEADLAATLGMIQLNIAALTELTRRLLPGMIERRRGRVLNVASTAAFQPGPLMAVYYASKAYVLHFSEALAAELEGAGVTCTALCPGPTATDFESRAGLDTSKLFTGRRVMNVEPVAEAGYAGVLRGQRVVIPGRWNQLLIQGSRFLPRRLVTSIVGRMQGRRA